jgi:hypothetical protein
MPPQGDEKAGWTILSMVVATDPADVVISLVSAGIWLLAHRCARASSCPLRGSEDNDAVGGAHTLPLRQYKKRVDLCFNQLLAELRSHM